MPLAIARAWEEGEHGAATPPHRFCLQLSGAVSPLVTACHQPRQSHQEVTTSQPHGRTHQGKQNPDLHLRVCTPAQTKPERRQPLLLAGEGALDLKEPRCRVHPSTPQVRRWQHQGSRARACGTHLGSRPWAGTLPGARRP